MKSLVTSAMILVWSFRDRERFAMKPLKAGDASMSFWIWIRSAWMAGRDSCLEPDWKMM